MFIWLESRKARVKIMRANAPVHICHIMVKAPRMAFGAASAE